MFSLNQKSVSIANGYLHCLQLLNIGILAGMLDGIYLGHTQIPQSQQKQGGKVTIRSTEALIGSYFGMDECAGNLAHMSGCPWSGAIRCASEKFVELMDGKDHGKIELGRRADLVAVDAEGNVTRAWINGQLIYGRTGNT